MSRTASVNHGGSRVSRCAASTHRTANVRVAVAPRVVRIDGLQLSRVEIERDGVHAADIRRRRKEFDEGRELAVAYRVLRVLHTLERLVRSQVFENDLAFVVQVIA
jgi:hypothetical protein